MIYIVEDDAAIRELEQYALQSSGYEVQSFETSEPFWQAMRTAEPELVILDVMLPRMNGFSLCETIRRTDQKIAIIILSAKGQEQDKIRGLSIGADDYITKPFNILEVKARIKAIMRRTAGPREKKEVSSIVEKGDLRLDCDSRRLFISGREVNLTAKEFDLLELLVKNENKVYSRENLLGLVWGKDYPGDVRTVDVHVRRLREKIETNPSEPKYVHTKWGVGYYYYQK